MIILAIKTIFVFGAMLYVSTTIGSAIASKR